MQKNQFFYWDSAVVELSAGIFDIIIFLVIVGGIYSLLI